MELSHLYGKYPHQMSGGEQQRCSMARAIIYQPELLMLDEPFSNVDALTTKSLRKSVHKLLKEFGITTLIVTHDLEDVYEMSQRCMVIEEGTVTQIDTLDNLKTNSNTPFIQQLFSEISVINGKIYKQIL
jgi:putative spermidine/putrescine transport system ATP-binding protein